MPLRDLLMGGHSKDEEAATNHALPYRAMDFNDGSRLEIYDEVHVFRRGELAEVFPVVPVVTFRNGHQPFTEATAAFRNADLGPAFKALADMVRTTTEPFARMFADRLEPPPNVMERALQARKNRNTGPARPSAASARRPRRHQ